MTYIIAARGNPGAGPDGPAAGLPARARATGDS
jgi:hypothetical protein